MDKAELKRFACDLGIDLVGVTTRARLDERLPPEDRPSRITEYLDTVLVLAKHIHAGAAGARDGIHKQFGGAVLHRSLEEASAELAYHLEAKGHVAAVIPSLFLDFRDRHPEDNCPAGQASRFLRLAAVEAGLGTLGLNMMLLTPRFGPRVILTGMLADLALEPDPPLAVELCPGLQGCGRCAAICPEDAIPRSATAGAPLAAVRGLDGRACARSSQPNGVGAYVEHLRNILKADGAGERLALVQSPATARIWQNMAVLRQGAFTGCMACMEVCPVGEDYARIQQSPHRQADLPGGVRRTPAGGRVMIAWAPRPPSG
jgi:epoxyqueuosine reductase